MADTTSGDVSRHAFQVSYYGADSDDHSMDVDALAPALLAFGKLIRESNAQLNGTRATIKVIVTSDFEHKCFNINFEVIQTAMEAIKSLLDDDNVKTATELLKTIGIIGTTTGTIAGGLLGFLKWKNGRKIKKVQKLSDTDSSGIVIVNVEGDNNSVHVTSNVFKLAENTKVLESLTETLGPIESKDAERIEFKQGDVPTASYDRKESAAIISSCAAGPDEAVIEVAKTNAEIVTATLHVYSPVFDNKAPLWRFTYKRKPIYANISKTSIAKEALRRGGSFVNDRYKVRMEVTPPDIEGGDTHYKILEVLDFEEAPQQKALPLPKGKKKARKRG